MINLKEKIQKTEKELNEKLEKTFNLDELEKIRIKFLGKKGIINELFLKFKSLSPEKKRIIGPLLNQLKKEGEALIKELKQNLIKKKIQLVHERKKYFDVTSYLPKIKDGHLHIYTQIIEEIENTFLTMGYEVVQGPEVEHEYYNFTGLNIPEDHPARDMHDTFWLNLPKTLLRTHTSPVQVHVMEKSSPPISSVSIGRCFRHEAIDVSHDFMFMQCEGFLVDKDISLANLFATAKTILQKLLNKNKLDIRIRPGFFPFVEPGVEIDIQCPFCKKGCSVCKKTKWIEIFPGGLIHPNVLKNSGIDPEKYSGFAFGFGLTRIAMIKYGINDARLFHSGKIKFLYQF